MQPNFTFRNTTKSVDYCLIVIMFRAVSARFVSFAVAFLIACVSILSLAAVSTFVHSSGKDCRQLRATILSTLLR